MSRYHQLNDVSCFIKNTRRCFKKPRHAIALHRRDVALHRRAYKGDGPSRAYKRRKVVDIHTNDLFTTLPL